MKEIKLKAHAKINIALDVLGKKPDGYHDVRMIMQTIDLYDKLKIKSVSGPKIEIITNLPYLPIDQRNLVYQIIDSLIKKHHIEEGIEVDLYKMIPVAAGLAGGSTDAAAAILGMNELFELGMTMDEMALFAKGFGADIPYCLYGGTALAEGIGEELMFLQPFPECYVVIAKPKFSVSTAYVYRNLVINEETKHPDVDGIITSINASRKDIIGSLMGNVLESVTAREYAIINELKATFIKSGAFGTLNSGS
ncbi:MAG: 4-(cytidine 5'-diphospho)-2-C-methyl-D-erythritol kinase, partial [Vallitaleaceae bacterium]|nr:4-(cytidine 5'-diphospho)-2-C-methyl-D-erythritol kinase [Vallitaleaceae bacterium]